VELLLALERATYDAVVGTAETDDIEFKEAPYQLDLPRQKWELAKDVAALANHRGGVIILGFRTQKAENQLVDTAAEHRQVPKDLVNWDSYRQILGRWIQPAVAGLSGRWFPADPGQDRGVFALIVPPQPATSKYFVVSEITREDGTFPGAVGVPIRQGDIVDWLRADSVHSLLREALWWRQHGPGVSDIRGAEAVLQATQERVGDRCREIETLARWGDTPFLALHASPDPPLARPGDFYSDTGLKGRVAEPQVLRRDGFNIWTLPEAEVRPDGSLLCATNPKVLWLSPDGFFSVATRADGEFLGWYFNQGHAPNEPTALNPRVVAEYVLEFCRFLHGELKPRSPAAWSLWLSIAGFDRQGGILLVPALGAGGNQLFYRHAFREEREAIQPRADRHILSGPTSGRDAHRLMAELYALFALPPDSIPYVRDGEVSAEAILEGVRR